MKIKFKTIVYNYLNISIVRIPLISPKLLNFRDEILSFLSLVIFNLWINIV